MQRINNDIKQGNFKHIYLLYGEERYLKRQYTHRLQNALCDHEDTMNVHWFEGKEVNVGEIIDLAETLPFLADKRVIFIKNSGLFKAGGEKLSEYLADINETAYFVFTESDVDKRSKLFKTVSSNGSVVEFTMQDENTLKRWIAGMINREEKKIAENTVMLFLSKTGTDMENIQMELEKLLCYCMDKDIITNEDVEAVCVEQINNRIFDMINAMAAKQLKQAISLYYDLLSLKEPPLRILYLIARQYNFLVQVKELKARGFGDKDIGGKIGCAPFFATKYAAQAAKFKLSDLKKALRQCVEAEEAIKTGRMSDLLSVELLIFQVTDATANGKA